ncbi:MAG: DUF4292 domain-containing protein [Bacteroidetes bacterium]|nr:DUF4292 domain-containing protein [Bacteroidota bacterium]
MPAVNYSIKISFVFCLILFSFSCKSKKNIVKPSAPVAVADTSNERCKMMFKTGKDLSRRMYESELDFVYASAKFSCHLVLDDDDNTFTVSVRCRKDSAIWLSISKLGIDAARVLITKDSVKFTLGLTEKKYFKGDFSYINQTLHTDLDYDVIQALLFGNSATFYDDDEKLKPGRDKDNCQYFLSTIRKRRLKKIASGDETPDDSYQTIWLDNETFKIIALEFDDVKTKRKFKASYSDFKAIDKYTAPYTLQYNITAEKSIKAEITYSRITLNEVQSFPFKIPKSYDPIQFKQK